MSLNRTPHKRVPRIRLALRSAVAFHRNPDWRIPGPSARKGLCGRIKSTFKSGPLARAQVRCRNPYRADTGPLQQQIPLPVFQLGVFVLGTVDLEYNRLYSRRTEQEIAPTLALDFRVLHPTGNGEHIEWHLRNQPSRCARPAAVHSLYQQLLELRIAHPLCEYRITPGPEPGNPGPPTPPLSGLRWLRAIVSQHQGASGGEHP